MPIEFSRRVIGGVAARAMQRRTAQSSAARTKPASNKSNQQTDVKARSYFPESWIWSVEQIRFLHFETYAMKRHHRVLFLP